MELTRCQKIAGFKPETPLTGRRLVNPALMRAENQNLSAGGTMNRSQMLDTVMNPNSDWAEYRNSEMAHDMAIERLLGEL